METLGKTLKSLREEKGMTLKEVSKATKIRVSVLAALENEEWEKLPQRIFIKGFVKAYTKAVEGDEALIMDLFESSCPVKDVAISCPPFEMEPMHGLEVRKKHYGWMIVLVILIVLAGILYFFFANFYGSERDHQGRIEREETTVVSPVPLKSKSQVSEEVGIPQQPREAPGSPVSEEKTEPKKAEVPADESRPVVGAGGSVVPQTRVGESPLPDGAGQSSEEVTSSEKKAEMGKDLIITAKMETWIGIKIDGKTRKEKLLKAGEVFSARVGKWAELLIGNAGGVEIMFDGKKVENIGKPGQVVRLRLPKSEPGRR